MARFSTAVLAFGAVLKSTAAIQLDSLNKFDRASSDLHNSPVLEDAYAGTFKAMGDPEPPRMLAMRGCSGSSAVMIFARALLRYHGIPVTAPSEPAWDVSGNPVAPTGAGWPAELLNPHINWLYADSGEHMGRAMNRMNNIMHNKHQTLFFKGMLQHMQGDDKGLDEWKQLAPTFEKIGLLAVVGSRENMLDQVVCQIKDCFQADYGEPVDAAGKESDLCFARRGDGKPMQQLTLEHTAETAATSVGAKQGSSLFFMDDGYKANVNIENLIDSIESEINIVNNVKRNLLSLNMTFKVISEEDLLEFETDMPGAMERGVRAWKMFLRSLGVQPNGHIIEEYLKQFAATYHSPPPHSDVIYNIDEVKTRLKGTSYESYIRN